MNRIIYYFLTLFIFLFGKVNAQDTIVDLKGNILTGKIISIDNNTKFITYVNGKDTLFRTLSSVQRYSLKDSLKATVVQIPTATSSPTQDDFRKSIAHRRQFSKYDYGKWSFGLNLMALLKPSIISDFDFLGNSYTTNRSLDLYAQYEYNSKLALRIPLRIGIQPLGHTYYPPASTSLNYGAYSRELIADIGFEPLVYFEGLRQISWYFLPSLTLGLGRKVLKVDGYPNPTFYVPKGNASHYKLSASFGFQANVTRTIQFGMESGLYLSNNMFTNFSSDPNAESARQNIIGLSLKVFTVWRLGGKKREK